MTTDSSQALKARPLAKSRPPAGVFTRVDRNLYRYSNGHFFERVRLDGKRTWRKLHAVTLKDARAELGARRAQLARAKAGLDVDPYTKTDHATVKDVLEHYAQLQFPDRRGRPRPPLGAAAEKTRFPKVMAFFGRMKMDELNWLTFNAYARTRRKPDGTVPGRAVDLELWTLSNALETARRSGLIESNPAMERPKFSGAPVHQARDRMPANADVLHELAAELLEERRSQALGWMLLIGALTGMRSSELRRLRIHALPRRPGHVDGDHLWLERSKRGVNPWVVIQPDLAACIQAHRNWLARHHPRAVFWFPSLRDEQEPVDSGALAHALGRLTVKRGRPAVTPHGLRAYFVTVRRSQGISDAQIAAEIGDATGATIVAQTYGQVPPNWQGLPGLTWIPKDRPPAWQPWL